MWEWDHMVKWVDKFTWAIWFLSIWHNIMFQQFNSWGRHIYQFSKIGDLLTIRHIRKKKTVTLTKGVLGSSCVFTPPFLSRTDFQYSVNVHWRRLDLTNRGDPRPGGHYRLGWSHVRKFTRPSRAYIPSGTKINCNQENSLLNVSAA